MKYLLSIVLVCVASLHSYAETTIYTFTSKDWKSAINATVCDGKTDGWMCDKEAYDYQTGYVDAQNRVYGRGVSVKTGTSGAGATSIVTFEEVRSVDINFCQNASKGKGSIFVQIGENTPHELIINRPAKSMGQYYRDTTIQISVAETGKIRFWINCSENAININTISIHSASEFDREVYKLVTDVNQLQDLDQIIIGVHDTEINHIMGYFDESISQNNIHAIGGKYSEDRTYVAADDDAIYTLHLTELDGKAAFYIEDNIRYEGAYLVASGTYGNYGYWDISVDSTGKAIIMNLGNSLGKYLQYNVGNHPALFACYAEPNKIPICIYRLTIEGRDDEEDIETDIQSVTTRPQTYKSLIKNQLVIISGEETYTILGTKL